MTAITSSAASETESARKRTPGRSGATALMIASPLPSGRCTSSTTTSGSSSLISGTASATLPASPTTSTASPSSALTPARKRSWSSTSTTRRVTLHLPQIPNPQERIRNREHPGSGRRRGRPDRGPIVAASVSRGPPRQVQLHLGALAGGRGDDGAAAGALHAALDRLDEAASVAGHGGTVEAGAAVAHEDGDGLVG